MTLAFHPAATADFHESRRPGLGKIALLLALQPSSPFEERVPPVHERDCTGNNSWGQNRGKIG